MKVEYVITALQRFIDHDRDGAFGILRMMEAHERSHGKLGPATRLAELLKRGGDRKLLKLPDAPPQVEVRLAERPIDTLILSRENRDTVDRVVAEWKGRDRLREHNLNPRNVLMFSGPSGNGKTALAESIATSLGLPLAMIDYSQVIDSHRGDTGKNIAKAIDWASKTPCVILFDEADSLMTTRRSDDPSAAGAEDRRTVNQTLIRLDSFGCHSMVVFATNMPQSLDPALNRRLSATIELGPPDEQQRQQMIHAMISRWPFLDGIDGDEWKGRAMRCDSFARIEALAMDAARTKVLAM